MVAPRVAELAANVSDVFFARSGPELDLHSTRSADDALAAALEAFEAVLDQLGEETAAATYELLRGVRQGEIDRATARIAAGGTLTRILADVETAEDSGPLAPLAVFLGALAAMADDDATAHSFDATPDPELPIEVAIGATLADPGARGDLCRTLEHGVLHVPVLDLDVTDDGVAIRFLPIVVQGTPMICGFTSPERFADHLAEAGVGEVPLLEVDGAELARLCPSGHGLAINPGSVLGLALDPIEADVLSARASSTGAAVSGPDRPTPTPDASQAPPDR